LKALSVIATPHRGVASIGPTNVKRLSAFIISTALVFIGCAEHKPTLRAVGANYASYDDPDGYSLLTELLVKEGEGWRNTTIRISALTTQEDSKSTTSFEKCIRVPDEFIEAANNFRDITKNSYVLRDRFGSDAHFQLVDQPGTNRSKSKNSSKQKRTIEQEISGGTFFVSPVGFDRNKTHAIVRINYICGGTCGGGEYHLLEQSADGWKEVKPKSFCFWQY
jgi:hypothetical protein